MDHAGHTGAALQISRFDGGSVVTDLGYNIRLNSGSTLKRSWVVLNDSECPIQLRVAGIGTAYSEQSYQFKQSGQLSCVEGLAALELRYILYDVFGRHLKTLSSTYVSDLTTGRTVELQELAEWVAWENEVSSFFTSVALVAHVRTAEGRIWRHNEKLLTDELARIELAASSGVLDPSSERR